MVGTAGLVPVQRVLPADPSSAAAARRFARDVLREWDEQDALEIVELLVSELVTNAVLHAGSGIELALRRRADQVRVEVADASPVLPTIRDYGIDASTGRGLGMVELLTTDWGVNRKLGDGKVVWFEVPAAHPTTEDAEADEIAIDLGDDDQVLRILGVPIQLFRAMQQHTDALLREYALVAVEQGLPTQAHLDIDRTAVPATLQAALEAGHTSVDLVLSAPLAARETIPRVRRALAAADALAGDGKLLATPPLPEVADLRDWFVEEVFRQLDGAAPEQWSAPVTPDARETAAIDHAAALQHLATATIVANDENQIAYANAAAEQLLGWPPGGLAGRRLTAVIPQRLHEAHVAGYTRFLVTGEARLLGQPVRVPARTLDGSEIPIELVLSSYTGSGGRRMFAGALLPVSGATSAREAMHQWLHAVDAAIGAVGSGAGLTELAPDILRIAGETLPWDTAALWLPKADALRCDAIWEREEGRFEPFVRATQQRTFGRGQGLPGTVWAAAKPRWITDLVADSNFPRAAVAIDAGLRTGCALPVITAGEVRGVIELFSSQVNVADADLLDVLGSFGSAVGLARS